MKKLLITLLTLFFSLAIYANTNNIQLSNSAKISITTCSPADAVYELFGHTGLRIKDDSLNIDLVANYGLFDFNQSDFIYRFVKGQTDYQVGITPFEYFIPMYINRGSKITECVLNLNQEEKNEIFLALQENLKPENKIYRYNFIFNNCATKVRDIIEEHIDGKIQYIVPVHDLSFRDAIGLYTTKAEWSQFGFDLCLGKGLDRMASSRELMFLPEILDKSFTNSHVIGTDGEKRNICSETNIISELNREEQAAIISPFTLFSIILIIILLISVYAYFKQIRLDIFDAVLFSINALGGCVILFLILFSSHPFTFANFNILWLNPFMFIPLIFVCFRFNRYIKLGFYGLLSIELTLLLFLMPAIPQEFNVAVYPLILTYLVRSSSHIFYWAYIERRKKQKRKGRK